jgi:hypothetical protein
MIKNQLRYLDLAVGTNDSRDESIARWLARVDDGAIDPADALRFLIGFKEYNNKRVYMLKASPADLAGFQASTLVRRVSHVGEVALHREPSAPSVSYSFFDDTTLRVSYAETHQKTVIDRAAQSVDLVPITKHIVLNVDFTTGFATLSFDTPEAVSPHDASAQYYAYYKARVNALVGAEFTVYDISSALMNLERSSLVRIPSGRSILADGRMDLTTDDDCRTMGVYPSVSGSLIAKDRGRYIWLCAASADILRDVPTDIYARTGMVRFTKDSLAPEVEYVIEQIRAHA